MTWTLALYGLLGMWIASGVAGYGGALASFHAMVNDTSTFPLWVEVTSRPDVGTYIKERAYGDVKIEEGKLFRKYEDMPSYWANHTRVPGIMLALGISILGPLGLLIVGRDFAFFGWRAW